MRSNCRYKNVFLLQIIRIIHMTVWIKGLFWRPIDQDQVLTTWSGGRQNGLVLNLWLCDVTALKAEVLNFMNFMSFMNFYE